MTANFRGWVNSATVLLKKKYLMYLKDAVTVVGEANGWRREGGKKERIHSLVHSPNVQID